MITIQIECSSLCNFNCKNCYRKKSTRATGHMDLILFKEIIDKIIDSKNLVNHIYMAGFGESTLNPKFWDMVKYAKQNDCSLMLPTNGSTLSEETVPKLRMIDSLQLSIDSLIINENLRGGNENPIKWLPLLKKYRIPTQLNITVNSRNFDEIPSFIHFAIRNNLNLYLMFSVPFFDKTKDLIEEHKYCIQKYNELSHLLSQYHVNAKIDTGCNSFKNCRYINHDFSIAWNGDLFPCNDGLLTNFDFGNVSQYSNFDLFVESDIMKQVASGNHQICDCCKKWDRYYEKTLKKKIIYDKRIDSYKDKHKGKRCFVIGHSPTLTKDMLLKIKDEITISVNQVGRIKETWDFDFEPTYYTIGDASMILRNSLRKNIENLKNSVKFYPELIFDQAAWSYSDVEQFTKKDYDFLEKNMIPINWINPSINHHSLQMPFKETISFDLRQGILESGTCIQGTALPWAVWIGCSEIYLMGCDMGNKDGRFYDSEVPFNIGYDVFRQYGWFAERMKEIGVKMYNIGPSKLPNVENIDIDTVLGNEHDKT